MLLHMPICHAIAFITKWPNLKLKTRPKQLLSYLLLAFSLPGNTYSQSKAPQYTQTISFTNLKKTGDKLSSLLGLFTSDKNKFIYVGTWVQCYKTFLPVIYDFFIISSSVCYTRLQKLAKYKQSSLLQKIIAYGQESFVKLAPDHPRPLVNVKTSGDPRAELVGSFTANVVCDRK